MPEPNDWEVEPPELCESCGQDLGIDPSRAYAVDEERTLCFECAVARGGVYDAEIDRWVEAPDVSGLVGDAEWENPQHPRPKTPYERGGA